MRSGARRGFSKPGGSGETERRRDTAAATGHVERAICPSCAGGLQLRVPCRRGQRCRPGGCLACRPTRNTQGDLLLHCRKAKGFVYCSTGSIYAYPGQRPLTEADAPGVPLRANYSFSKIAGESICTWVAGHFKIPLTIIRICSTYGPEGGAPADRLKMMLEGKPIRLHPDKPNNYNPIYEDDYVELGIRAMEVASLAAAAGELVRQRDGQCGGLLRLHGRTGGRRTHLRVHA